MVVYELRDQDKPFLRSGVGTLYSSSEPRENAAKALKYVKKQLYTVGDFCTDTVLQAGGEPDLIVYDNRTNRTEQYELSFDRSSYLHLHAANPAGSITHEAFRRLGEALDNLPAALKIDGEEDLITAALIVLASPGDSIIYGDPGIEGDEGLRLVHVDQHIRARLAAMLGLADDAEPQP
ncbi:MAG: DUF359 domain-containing protein [Candidatus Nanohaloarchaea archaeon]|nr:DUF359 domain-containing protein [Candidatus Nanohaloarchaea archaeon]